MSDDGSPVPLDEHPALVTLRTGRPCRRVVMGIETPEGRLVWIEINSQPLIQPDRAHLYGVVVSFSDITERRRREREADLQDALVKLRLLRGILPICASCKRIRDDRGEWQLLETYLQDHSEAEFTHGYCPECLARMYGEESPAV
ncbi:MAG: hypothetical protein ACREMG_03685 [Gemmatimonadales bacterium]